MSVQLQVKHTTKLLTLPAQCVHCAKWQRGTYTAMLKHNGRAPCSTIVPWKASSFTHLCVCAYEGSLWVRYSPLWFKVARWAYQRKTNISIIVSLQTLYFPWCSRNKTWHSFSTDGTDGLSKPTLEKGQCHTISIFFFFYKEWTEKDMGKTTWALHTKKRELSN